MSTTALRASKESPSTQAEVPPVSLPAANAGLFADETRAPLGRTATPAPDLDSQRASATDLSVDTAKVSRIAAASIATGEGPRNQVVAEWHGMVTAVLEATFVAELKGLLGEGVSGAIEEAVIPIDEVREEDLALLEPGAFFRLTVNNVLRPNGKTRRRFTDVTFRRLPAYRRDELEEASERARAFARVIRVE